MPTQQAPFGGVFQNGKFFRQGEAYEIDPIPGLPPGRGDFLLPHAITFQGLVSSLAKVYRNPDQAFQDSLDNSRSMRNDLAIMECVEQRQRSVAMLGWHLEIEGEKAEKHADFLKEMTSIVGATGSSPGREINAKPFAEYRRSLLEANWYGKQGMQHAVGWKFIQGKNRLIVKDWRPINGDKLCFRYDDGSGQYEPGQPGIRVRTSFGLQPGERVRLWNSLTSEWREIQVENISGTGWTDRGLAYFLDAEMQKQLIVHRYMIEDAAYEIPIQAGSVDGIGIRSRIYWTWFQKNETLSYLMEYLERSALGIELWYYPANNETVKQEVITAATQRFANGRNVIFVPRYIGDDGSGSGVDRIDPSAAGAECIKSILTDFFGHQIKRYILGQTLTSEAEGVGMGSKLPEIQLGSYLQIIGYDAAGEDETLTNQLVRRLQGWNYTDSYQRELPIRFVTDTQSEDTESKLLAWKAAYDMGLKIPNKDVYPLIGASQPGVDEDYLQNPEAEQRDRQKAAAKAQALSPQLAQRETALRFVKDDEGHEHAPAGQKTGGQFVSQGDSGGDSGAATKKSPKPKSPNSPEIKLKPSKTRAFEGRQVPIATPVSKQETGKIGEAIVISFLKSRGLKDARYLNLDRNNYPIDLVQDHESIEVKTGLAGNGPRAQQWRLTIGQPGKEETAWLAKANDETKARWNAGKQQAIHDRKTRALKDIAEQLNHAVSPATMTVILNPDTKTADIYKFDGWHDRIGWNSDMAKAAYIGSLKYE